MSSFTSKLKVRRVGDRMWVVTEPFRYYIGKEDSNYWIDIPLGYQTDLASIPKAFYWLFKNDDPMYAQAAVIHDWLCERRLTTLAVAGGYCCKPVSRAEADDIFLEAMGVLKCPAYKKLPLFVAVRAYATFTGKV